MRTILYLIGFLSSMSFVAGWTFALLHWQGANALSTYGLFGFAFIFVPYFAYEHSKKNKQRALSEKIKLMSGVTGVIAIALSVVFKLLHFQGADIMLLLGVGIFVFGFLPFLFLSMYRKSAS